MREVKPPRDEGDYTLDEAKKRFGQWVPAGYGTEAKLDWTPKYGWALHFRARGTTRIYAQTFFHRNRGIQGYSWPGAMQLSELENVGQWQQRKNNSRWRPERTWSWHFWV